MLDKSQKYPKSDTEKDYDYPSDNLNNIGSVDFKKLLDISEVHERTPESIEAFKERVRLREMEFAKQSKLQTPTSEWYERSYDI